MKKNLIGKIFIKKKINIMANEQAVKMCSTKYLINEMGLELKTEELTDAQQYLLIDGNCPFKRDIGCFYFNGYPAEINNADINDNQLFPYSAVTRVEYPDMEIIQGSEFSGLSDSGETFNDFSVNYCKSIDTIDVTINNTEISKYGLQFILQNIESNESIGEYTFELAIRVIDGETVQNTIFKPHINEENIPIKFKLCGIGLNNHIVCYSFVIEFSNTLYESEEINPHGIILFNNKKETIATGTDNIIYFTYTNINKNTITIDVGASASKVTSELHIYDNSTNVSGSGYISLSTAKTEFDDFNITIRGKELHYTSYVNDTVVISLN